MIWDDFDYMSHVQPAAEAFGIDELSDWKLPSRHDEYCLEACRNFRAEATRVSARMPYRYSTLPERDPNTVALDAETKRKLRFHLQQIHELIDEQDLPEWTKAELHEAVSALEKEFDKARTRLSTVLETLVNAWQGSESVGDALRKVVTIVQDAKKVEREKPAIAAPAPQKQLPAPKPKEIWGGIDKSLDDEIPF